MGAEEHAGGGARGPLGAARSAALVKKAPPGSPLPGRGLG